MKVPHFERDWLKHIHLNWKSICAIRAVEQPTERRVQQFLTTYSEIVRDELSTVSSMKVKLHVKPDARSKFFKPCSVLFAIKPAIDQELESLESAGILRKVFTSDWATPIVPVPKRDGMFRICGDYKATINPQLSRPYTRQLLSPVTRQHYCSCVLRMKYVSNAAFYKLLENRQPVHPRLNNL